MQSLSKAALTLIFDNPEPLAILSMNRYNIKKSAHPIPAPFQTRGKPGGGWSAWNGAWDGRTEDQEMNNRLCVIGEALIDFIPDRKGQRLKDVSGFKRVAGGAPANVAGAVTKLGISSKMLTKLGADPFGDYIEEVLQEAGIDTAHIRRDSRGETALAFVSLAEDGNREDRKSVV